MPQVAPVRFFSNGDLQTFRGQIWNMVIQWSVSLKTAISPPPTIPSWQLTPALWLGALVATPPSQYTWDAQPPRQVVTCLQRPSPDERMQFPVSHFAEQGASEQLYCLYSAVSPSPFGPVLSQDIHRWPRDLLQQNLSFFQSSPSVNRSTHSDKFLSWRRHCSLTWGFDPQTAVGYGDQRPPAPVPFPRLSSKDQPPAQKWRTSSVSFPIYFPNTLGSIGKLGAINKLDYRKIRNK